VWLGMKNDRLVAMKQFPKTKGNNFDTSALVELQIQKVILRNSDAQGKPFFTHLTLYF
jgi:hypothetical protein